jgi:uncharacterized surface anchored protein
LLGAVAFVELGSLAKQAGSDITIIKKDAVDQTMLLDGAEFSLYEESCEEVANATPVATGTSGSDGQGTTVFAELTGPRYCVVETQPPDGYSGVNKGLAISPGMTGIVLNNPLPPPPQEGEITVILRDNATNDPIDGAVFDIYAGACKDIGDESPIASGTSGDDGEGTVVFKVLDNTPYCVMESSPPPGYAIVHGGATVSVGMTLNMINHLAAPVPAASPSS